MSLDKQKLLELVEWICYYSPEEDVQMDIANGRKVSKREKELADALGQIYCAVHGHSETCPHENWKKQATELYCKFIKMNK